MNKAAPNLGRKTTTTNSFDDGAYVRASRGRPKRAEEEDE
jgi:hypothetical protein